MLFFVLPALQRIGFFSAVRYRIWRAFDYGEVISSKTTEKLQVFLKIRAKYGEPLSSKTEKYSLTHFFC